MITGKILIVDDEPVNLMVIERLLEDAGHHDFLSTTRPEEVVRLVQEYRPDLILLDLHMPVLDGFALLSLLEPLRVAAGLLPVLILTADATLATKRRALAAGATDFLPKPFDAVEATLRIGNLLTMRQGHVHIEEAVQERTAELRRALTDLDETQNKIVQKERLSALGEMTTGIAHDFNNALALILGFGELLLIESEGEMRRTTVAEHSRIIMTAAEDAAIIIRRLRDFHRPAANIHLREQIQLNEIILSAIAFTRPLWENQTLAAGSTFQMKTELGALPAIAGNAAELREILVNLIFNSVHAMPGGGSITFSTAQKNGNVELRVQDTGFGMPEEVRRRALEPYFTTKGEGGSGLGLSMVYGIVQRHQGTIEISSAPGAGTTFTITLPVASAACDQVGPPTADAARGLRILLVDDKLVLCDIVAEFLTRDHHEVVTTGNAQAALEAFSAQPFDLVITDRIMPGMTGDQLALQIKQTSPTTPIILLTGYYDTGNSNNRLAGIDLIVPKPATHAALRLAVATVMSPAQFEPEIALVT